ncbi:hypothetical protein GCM10009760_46030 [Kitasatospora kazusensis]|uniref:Excalibur calcium-binding domain-containing protein n=1 Tax=Kitasatospora kazusensis TaxID=407974 RepID=A0ABN3A023_9ACTN
MTDRTPSHRRRGGSRGRRVAAAVLGTGAAAALAFVLATGGAASRPAAAGPPPQPPAPHVLNFANEVQAPAQQAATPEASPGRPSAAAPAPARQPAAGPTEVPVAADADGCDHAYGQINQCVPRAFPAGVQDTPAARCGWLVAHGYHALAVHARDDLGLDSNGDGVACGPGDAGAAA